MPEEFFPQRPAPQIYAYILPDVKTHEGFIKIGYTTRNPKKRIDEQLRTAQIKYKILLTEPALRDDGTIFTDKDIHAVLIKNKFARLDNQNNEWFKCSLKDIQEAIIAVKERKTKLKGRSKNFKMRPEQNNAVEKTFNYFTGMKKENPNIAPKFLWNAKMRFGKTFAAYQLCKKMNFKKILILTFKPVVESAWSEDLMTHRDFEGWEFISNKNKNFNSFNFDGAQNLIFPVVVFGSFQDILGTNKNGGIKAKNEFIHKTEWDIVIFDEYHFGAWRENAKKLFKKNDFDEEKEFDIDPDKSEKDDENFDFYDENDLPITAGHYLFLSGTPFRALNSGEFIEEQIFSWTYSDEQRAKINWKDDKNKNPYESLPRMVMMTYQIPDSIKKIASEGEFNEFDLNLFFSVKNDKKEKIKIEDTRFYYEDYVKKWVSLIRGSYLPLEHEILKLGYEKKPPMPYSDSRLLKILNHTLWFLPDVASCYAMYNLLREDNFFSDYKIIVCAGTKAGVGLDALPPVLNAIENENPFDTKTITLSCGKLTTGVTVREWSGVFMLRNLKSPETYFQTAFRVQSPWTMTDGLAEEIIIKKECYIFDFSLDRALRQISDYSCRLNVEGENPEKKVAEFIKFLPVLAFQDGVMKEINAKDILDIAMTGTSGTLLARRWQSALLVNVNDEILKRILADPELLESLMKIKTFRALNKDLETIINTSENVKKGKKNENSTPEEKAKLTEEEKKLIRLRKELKEKLIKFCTRIPIFMYLTDEREENLKDVIRQIDSKLFTRVTGLEIKTFDLMCALGVFNSELMNEAIANFKRYEDSSLEYTGLIKHTEENIGLYDKKIPRKEFYEKDFDYEEEFEKVNEEIKIKNENVKEMGIFQKFFNIFLGKKGEKNNERNF